MLHIQREGQRRWVLDLSNLRPCADIVYPAPKMRLETIPRNYIASPNEWPKLSDQGYWQVGYMSFVDSSGRGWIRTSKGLDEHSSPPADYNMNIIWFNYEEVNKSGLCEGEGR